MTSSVRVGVTTLDRLLGDWRSGGAGYRSLADRIELLLVDGRLVSGSRLPAERELAHGLGLSRTTVTGAYAVLRDRGVLTSMRGSGSVLGLPGARPSTPVSGAVVADLSNAVPPAWSGLPGHVARAAARLPSLLPTTGLDFSGLLELRERIAERYVQRGVPTTPEQILVTMGAQHAIGLTLHVLLRRGERAAVDVPSYPHALDALRDAGARLIPIGMPDARPDVDEWERVLLQSRPACAYLMPDFHNPTGSSLTDDERRRILAAAARSGTTLLVDETTAELQIDRVGTFTPMAALALGSGADVVSIGSVGKTVWHGLRLGWLRADRRIIGAVAAARPARDLGTPVLEQLVVAELLPEIDQVLADRAGALGATRDAAVAALRAHLPGWTVPVPAGGLCIWVSLPQASSSRLVTAAALDGLAVIAGPRFGIDGAFERNLRIPITGTPEGTVAAIELLARAWERTGAVLVPHEEFAPVL